MKNALIKTRQCVELIIIKCLCDKLKYSPIILLTNSSSCQVQRPNKLYFLLTWQKQENLLYEQFNSLGLLTHRKIKERNKTWLLNN